MCSPHLVLRALPPSATVESNIEASGGGAGRAGDLNFLTFSGGICDFSVFLLFLKNVLRFGLCFSAPGGQQIILLAPFPPSLTILGSSSDTILSKTSRSVPNPNLKGEEHDLLTSSGRFSNKLFSPIYIS